MNKQLPKDETVMAKKHMRKCATSLPLREMLIETILRFSLITATIKSTTNADEDQYQREC